jgi:ATP-dependent Clp protease ATP-binding subunit ClpC
MTILSKIALNVASLLGRRPPAPAIPFDAQVLTTLDMAAEDARLHGGRPIEPDHILLALVATTESGAAQLLKQLRVDSAVVTQRLRALQPDGPAGPEQIVPLYTDRGRRVLEGALFEAAETIAQSADSLHLLAGVLREGQSLAVRILADIGVTLEVVRAARGRAET